MCRGRPERLLGESAPLWGLTVLEMQTNVGLQRDRSHKLFYCTECNFFYIKEIIMCHSKTTNPHLTCVEDKSEPRPQSSALLLPADYKKKDGALWKPHLNHRVYVYQTSYYQDCVIPAPLFHQAPVPHDLISHGDPCDHTFVQLMGKGYIFSAHFRAVRLKNENIFFITSTVSMSSCCCQWKQQLRYLLCKYYHLFGETVFLFGNIQQLIPKFGICMLVWDTKYWSNKVQSWQKRLFFII